eukprot:NODE_522_length_6531_cov_0.547575.p2 type:complete len:475 gc:universal NODE_522_length_6531_cov_0.547575:1440-2864(+)
MNRDSEKINKLVDHVKYLTNLVKSQRKIIQENNITYFINKIDVLSKESNHLRLVNNKIQEQLNQITKFVEGDSKLDRKGFAQQLILSEQRYNKEIESKEISHNEEIQKLKINFTDQINALKKRNHENLNSFKIESSKQTQELLARHIVEKSELEEKLLQVQQAYQKEITTLQSRNLCKLEEVKQKFDNRLAEIQTKQELQLSEKERKYSEDNQKLRADFQSQISEISLRNSHDTSHLKEMHQSELARLQDFFEQKLESENLQKNQHYNHKIQMIEDELKGRLREQERKYQIEKENLIATNKEIEQKLESDILLHNTEHQHRCKILMNEIKDLKSKNVYLTKELERKDEQIDLLTQNLESSHIQLNNIVKEKHMIESSILDLESKNQSTQQHYEHALKMIDEKDRVVQDGQSKLKCLTEQLTEISAIKKSSHMSMKSFSVFAEDFDEWVESREKDTSGKREEVNHNMIITGIDMI